MSVYIWTPPMVLPWPPPWPPFARPFKKSAVGPALTRGAVLYRPQGALPHRSSLLGDSYRYTYSNIYEIYKHI